jgi:hypothetical protein
VDFVDPSDFQVMGGIILGRADATPGINQ